uniref:Methyltransferase HEMK2 n=1 Tax=Cyprinus carpio TaxID=7962 RepID=A0A8C2KL09_CYPCA
MYPTPLYAPAGHGAFTDVYEPAEDSFLLMDALEKDAEWLKGSRPSVCLEVGSGSGVVSAFLASVVGPGALYLCTDVNPAAAQCTLQTARCNHLQLQPVITDLVQCLLPRLNGKVDVLVFNPPYVVTPSDEVNENQKRSVMLHSQSRAFTMKTKYLLFEFACISIFIVCFNFSNFDVVFVIFISYFFIFLISFHLFLFTIN